MLLHPKVASTVSSEIDRFGACNLYTYERAIAYA